VDSTAREAVINALRSVPMFGDLEPQHLDTLAAYATEVSWPSDTLIFREADPDDKFYILLDGLVALDTYIPSRGRVIIQTIGANEVLGWSAALPQVEKKTASARTLLATRAIAIDSIGLCKVCEENHHLGFHVYRALATVIASRLKATRLQLLDIYSIGERK
jgi:CRP-like cAMP-binding protein